MTIRELIERLEKAEGPSYALECDIAKHVDDYSVRKSVPNYTASIDAALTLVPEGMCYSIEMRGNYVCAEVFRYRWGLTGGKYDIYFSEEGGHFRDPSPAITLCIAALKAQEAQS